MGQKGIKGGRKILENKSKWLMGWVLESKGKGLEGGLPVIGDGILHKVGNGS